MSFKSVDEIYNFDFQDSTISNFKMNNDYVSFEVDALIVEPENSQNENFTKSYADTVRVKLVDGKLLSGIKDGYRRYDANNKLVEEVDDESLDNEESKLILKSMNGAYIFAMDACKNSTEDLFIYEISIEFPSENVYDTLVTKSYRFRFSFTKAVFEWDKYLNKVQ